MAIISYLDAFPAPNALDILARHPEHQVVRIDSTAPVDDSFAALADAHAYQLVGARDLVPPPLLVDAAFLKRTPNMLVVSSSGAGVDVFDRAACNDAGVLIVNQTGANALAVAETAVTMMMAIAKNLIVADRALHAGWTGHRTEFFGNDLSGRTVGIVGIGNIGRQVARLAGAFGCRRLACDPYVDADETVARGAEKTSFDDLLARADFITVHTPLTDETRYIFNAAAFAAMKPGAIFINCARGFIHDEAALSDAISSGHLFGAGLDVFEVEPPRPDHHLLQLPTVIASPHIAGGTHAAVAKMAEYAATQFIDIFAGKPAPRPVNPEVLPDFQRRFDGIIG